MTTDKKLGKQVTKNDRAINEKRFQIENECLITIATQQPMASDLRILASILEIVTDLERIGDYGKGLSKISRKIKEQPIIPVMEHLNGMTDVAVDMMQRAVKAFVEGDIETARSIPALDDKVDKGFNKIYKGLMEYMAENPETIEYSNHLQWAAHNIERMADRVSNICERTLFIETGSIYEIEESGDEYYAMN
jgi:phosphate transport system protein